jgi:hypothetical protein
MVMIQFECANDKIVDALEALKGIASGQTTKIWTPMKIPVLAADLQAFEQKAQAIAAAIKPRPNQKMRAEALRYVFNESNTYWAQQGDPDPALRNATGALSKALRRFAPYHESPLDIVCERRREVFDKGPMKGTYQGVQYVLTKLGKRVRDILKELGII